MLCGENVTVKQLVYLLISCGFRKCELWTQKAYINRNFDTYNSLTPNWYYKVLR